jgi:hypothetical protein
MFRKFIPQIQKNLEKERGLNQMLTSRDPHLKLYATRGHLS